MRPVIGYRQIGDAPCCGKNWRIFLDADKFKLSTSENLVTGNFQSATVHLEKSLSFGLGTENSSISQKS
jgi:hypothetical protein